MHKEIYWNKKQECMSIEARRILQLERLQKTVRHAFDHMPLYHKKMQATGIEPGDIKELDDLRKLPFTTKQDLRDSYPYGMIAVPLEKIVRFHASSGTTGQSTVSAYTQNDIDSWTECSARSITSAGGTAKDILQISYGYGLFTGGLGLHYGGEKVGMSVIPTSSGNTRRQIQMMVDLGTTMLACTPSYAMYLAESIEEMGVKQDRLRLKSGLFGAEPWTEAMKAELEKRLNIQAFDIYGLSEVMGPGVAISCQHNDGMHVFDDYFLPEVIDPDTQVVLPKKTQGELVFTCIAKEGIPLIRYRTRDVAALNDDICPCGRTHVRMNKITGRTDDMLIIRGVNIFPSQVEAILLELNLATPNYHIIVDRDGALDTLEVQVEILEDMFSDHIKGLEHISRTIAKELNNILGVGCKVTLVEPKSLPRSEGKAKRVTDKRNLK